MNQAKGCGPRLRISDRMTSINAAFPVCVLNVPPAYAESFGVASAQRSTLAWRAGLSLVIERSALARTLGDIVIRKV